jgi:hypothetical protein
MQMNVQTPTLLLSDYPSPEQSHSSKRRPHPRRSGRDKRRLRRRRRGSRGLGRPLGRSHRHRGMSLLGCLIGRVMGLLGGIRLGVGNRLGLVRLGVCDGLGLLAVIICVGVLLARGAATLGLGIASRGSDDLVGSRAADALALELARVGGEGRSGFVGALAVLGEGADDQAGRDSAGAAEVGGGSDCGTSRRGVGRWRDGGCGRCRVGIRCSGGAYGSEAEERRHEAHRGAWGQYAKRAWS